VRTRTATVPLRPNGICPLTCPAETKKSGIAWPLTSTEVPAMEVGKGVVEALLVDAARPLPKTATNDPGATAAV